MGLRYRAVFLLVVLPPAALCGSFRAGFSEVDPSSAFDSEKQGQPELAEEVKQILARVNTLRKESGRPELKVDPKLRKAAEEFAEFMAEHDKYGHDADDKEPADRVAKHHYTFCVLSENIAYQFSSAGFDTATLAARFFNGWKDSPGHRANMLNPDVKETGLAIKRSEHSGKYYAVQLFGRPRSAAITFEITNQSEEKFDYHLGDEKYTLEPRFTRTHELCRQGELQFDWTEAQGEPITLRPGQGDKFVITKLDGKFRVKK